jgi:hypothetical protein
MVEQIWDQFDSDKSGTLNKKECRELFDMFMR